MILVVGDGWWVGAGGRVMVGGLDDTGGRVMVGGLDDTGGRVGAGC